MRYKNLINWKESLPVKVRMKVGWVELEVTCDLLGHGAGSGRLYVKKNYVAGLITGSGSGSKF
jgi:hypothetical protein